MISSRSVSTRQSRVDAPASLIQPAPRWGGAGEQAGEQVCHLGMGRYEGRADATMMRGAGERASRQVCQLRLGRESS